MSFLQVINPFGLLFAALLLLPHILFRGLRTVTKENVPNLGMYWLDRLGRFGSLFLMSVHTGVLEKGFTDPKELMQRFWCWCTGCCGYYSQKEITKLPPTASLPQVPPP